MKKKLNKKYNVHIKKDFEFENLLIVIKEKIATTLL